MESIKRQRTQAKESTKTTERTVPSSLVCTFTSSLDGTKTSALDLPVHSTTKQLEALLNSLLSNVEPLPYAFYVADVEVGNSLQETVQALLAEDESMSLEAVLNISYQPLSVFRVRPVTRCSETMPGHTDAVLHVSYSHDGKRLASGSGGKRTALLPQSPY
jgi:ribosome assembly protein 4